MRGVELYSVALVAYWSVGETNKLSSSFQRLIQIDISCTAAYDPQRLVTLVISTGDS